MEESIPLNKQELRLGLEYMNSPFYLHLIRIGYDCI